jgi:hypothetical protein
MFHSARPIRPSALRRLVKITPSVLPSQRQNNLKSFTSANHAMSTIPCTSQRPERKCGRRVRCDSLMTRSCGSITSSGGNLKAFERFSMSMSTMSVVASERVVLGNDPTGDRTIPPQATDVSRIEMRLFRDTRSVLEYLSQADILVSN